MGLRKTGPAENHPGFSMSYHQSHDGTWYLEWRATSYSLRPVARRRARDTEIALIERVLELEKQLANPSAPRPVASLKLKPFKYQRPLDAKSNPTT